MWLSSPLWRTELPDLDPQVGAIWPLGQVHMLGLEQKPSPQGLRQIAENSKNNDWRHLLIAWPSQTSININRWYSNRSTHLLCLVVSYTHTNMFKSIPENLQIQSPGLSMRQTCSSSRHMPAVLFRKYRLNRINAITHDAHILECIQTTDYNRNVLVKCGQREVRRSERLHCDRDPLARLTFTCKQHHPTHRAWETARVTQHKHSLPERCQSIQLQDESEKQWSGAELAEPRPPLWTTVLLISGAEHSKQEAEEDLRTMHWFPPVKVFHPGQQYAWWRDHTHSACGNSSAELNRARGQNQI